MSVDIIGPPSNLIPTRPDRGIRTRSKPKVILAIDQRVQTTTLALFEVGRDSAPNHLITNYKTPDTYKDAMTTLIKESLGLLGGKELTGIGISALAEVAPDGNTIKTSKMATPLGIAGKTFAEDIAMMLKEEDLKRIFMLNTYAAGAYAEMMSSSHHRGGAYVGLHNSGLGIGIFANNGREKLLIPGDIDGLTQANAGRLPRMLAQKLKPYTDVMNIDSIAVDESTTTANPHLIVDLRKQLQETLGDNAPIVRSPTYPGPIQANPLVGASFAAEAHINMDTPSPIVIYGGITEAAHRLLRT